MIPEQWNRLIQALEDENASVRWNAAYSLERLNDTSEVELLIEALNDENETVQDYATKALGKLLRI